MAIQYTEVNGKTYGKVSQLNDGEQSQIFEARFDKIYEGEARASTIEGKPEWKPLSLGVLDESGKEVGLSVTFMFKKAFDKAGLKMGSKFRAMKVGRAVTCIPVDAGASSPPKVVVNVPSVTLTSVEQEIVTAYKEHIGKHPKADLMPGIIDTCKQSGVPEDRADALYEAAKA